VSLGKTQALFVVVLLYAGAVSLFVATSTSQVLDRPASESWDLLMGGFTFAYVLGSAIGFMILVGIVDLIARRDQQLLLALTIGLAGAATWQAASQIVFIRNLAYYKDKQTNPVVEPPAPAETRKEEMQ
jgi:hypothetical protein